MDATRRAACCNHIGLIAVACASTPAPKSDKPEATLSKSDQNLSSLSADNALLNAAKSRVAIEGVWPEIDGGRFPAKRAVGDILVVGADIFCDGHDEIDAALIYRREDESDWHETAMRLLENDRWRGEFLLERNARYLYTIVAWRDLYASWCDEVAKKHAAGQAIALELIEGLHLVEKTIAEADRDTQADRRDLQELLEALQQTQSDGAKLKLLTSPDVRKLFARAGLRTNLTRYDKELAVWVDRRLAVFGAWYEMFPRCQSGDAHRHGTFDDVVARLSYVRDLGFDVLYFPPVHPIGRTNRKGPQQFA